MATETDNPLNNASEDLIMQKQEFRNKETRIEDMKASLDNLSAELCIDPDKLAEFGRQWSSGFHCYSLYNQILIWFQRPDASLVAGLSKWKSLGRFINKGEKMIWIWAPKMVSIKDKETGEKETRCIGFKSVPVCAYEQTEGKEIDFDKFGATKYISGNADIDILAVAKELGIEVDMKKWLGGANGRIWHKDDKVELVEKKNKAAVAATGFHEFAHKFLGHTAEKKNMPSHIKEIQAEAVSFLVCSCFGIKNEKSKYYIAGWKGTKAEIAEYGHDMIKVASRIVAAVDKTLKQ